MNKDIAKELEKLADMLADEMLADPDNAPEVKAAVRSVRAARRIPDVLKEVFLAVPGRPKPEDADCLSACADALESALGLVRKAKELVVKSNAEAAR